MKLTQRFYLFYLSLLLICICCKDESSNLPDGRKSLSDESELYTFIFPSTMNSTLVSDITAAVDQKMKHIIIEFPKNIDITQLKALVNISKGATISPDPSIAMDYINKVSFIITAENGTRKEVYSTVIMRNHDTPIIVSNSLDTFYIQPTTLFYMGEEITTRRDTIVRTDNTQSIFHILQKHNSKFYTIEIAVSSGNVPSLAILSVSDKFRYDDSPYQGDELKKLPFPNTKHAYKSNSEKDLALFNVNDIVDSKGYIHNIPSSIIDEWEEKTLKRVGSVVRISGGGTGWFIDKDLVLTNEHVVGPPAVNGDYTSSRYKSITLFDGRTTRGRSWFSSRSHDIALVKLEDSFEDINLLSLTNHTSSKGELFLSIGGPNIAYTYGEYLAILGIADTYYSFDLSTHMSSVSGQSGSPAFNLRGEIVGMVKSVGYSTDIRSDVNYFRISSYVTSPIIYANPTLIMDPFLGPTNSTQVSSEAILRLLRFWLSGVGRRIPDQTNQLSRRYVWPKASEEFYNRVDIDFPKSTIPSINSNLPDILHSIVTINKKPNSRYSTTSAQTAVIYDENYL